MFHNKFKASACKTVLHEIQAMSPNHNSADINTLYSFSFHPPLSSVLHRSWILLVYKLDIYKIYVKHYYLYNINNNNNNNRTRDGRILILSALCQHTVERTESENLSSKSNSPDLILQSRKLQSSPPNIKTMSEKLEFSETHKAKCKHSKYIYLT